MLNSAKNILWIDISEYTSRNTNTNTIIVTFMHKRAVKYGSSQPCLCVSCFGEKKQGVRFLLFGVHCLVEVPQFKRSVLRGRQQHGLAGVKGQRSDGSRSGFVA